MLLEFPPFDRLRAGSFAKDAIGVGTGETKVPRFARNDRAERDAVESVRWWHAAVFLEPVEFFSHFDFAVPGIFAEAMAFAGED
jgi:hypothetical protein